MLPWLVAYALVLLVWALIIMRRSTPTLWKGSSLVIVNSLFVIATIIYGIRHRNSGAPSAEDASEAQAQVQMAKDNNDIRTWGGSR